MSEIEMLKARFKVDRYGWVECEYDELAALHGDVVASLELGDYQGDKLYVIRDRVSDLYGYAQTGYGSCSGCDALQDAEWRIRSDDPKVANEGWVELAEIAKRLCPTVWYSAPEMMRWLREHDWRSDWLSGSEETIRAWIEKDVDAALAARQQQAEATEVE